jgi:hypothetical protein
MDSIKKRMGLLKNLPADESPGVEENLINLSLLNTIKLPKNLAHLTKDLPKSNYISNRVDSATIQSTGNKKLVPPHHQGGSRMQSEPAIPNSRQLPSIYSLKEPKYEQNVGDGLKNAIEPPAIVKQTRRSKQSSDGAGEILLPVKRQLEVIMENREERNRPVEGPSGTTPGSRTQRRPKPSAVGGQRERESHTYDPPSGLKQNYHYKNQMPLSQVTA